MFEVLSSPFSYSFIANEAGAEPSENLQVVKITLIPTPVS